MAKGLQHNFKSLTKEQSKKIDWRWKDINLRLWARVRKTRGCWHWTGGVDSSGYGSIYYQKRLWSAHRLSYSLSVGAIPRGKQINHTCDNTRCVNPKHLWIGTQQENIADRVQKKRSYRAHGSKNASSKLTERKVRNIKRLLQQGVTYSQLSRAYKVATSTIGRIARDTHWKHVKLNECTN